MIALPLGQMFYTVQKTTLASLVTFFVCNYVRLGLGRQTAQYRCTGSEGEIKEGDVRKPTPMAEQSKSVQGVFIKDVTNLRGGDGSKLEGKVMTDSQESISSRVVVWQKSHKRAVRTT